MTQRGIWSATVVLSGALILVVAVVVWLGDRRRDAPVQATDLERLDVYGRVPPFTLTERSGRPLGLDNLCGVVWVADFIYTRCKDTCPTLSVELARLQREFSDAKDLRLVSITVDPEHDTPEVLRQYAQRFGATSRWWFLTGTLREIYCLATHGFRLSVAAPEATTSIECGTAFRLGPRPAWAHGLTMHSARIVLVDRATRIRAYHLIADPQSPKNLRVNLHRVLAER